MSDPRDSSDQPLESARERFVFNVLGCLLLLLGGLVLVAMAVLGVFGA